jgi:hypothetical protein
MYLRVSLATRYCLLYSTSRANNLGSRLEHPHPRAYTRRFQNFGSPNYDALRLTTHVPGKSFPIPNPFPTGVSTGVPTGSPTGSPTNYRKSNPTSLTRIARGRLASTREQFFESVARLGVLAVGFGATARDGNKLGNSRIGEAVSRFPRFVRVAAGTCGGGSRCRMACLEWGELRREETDCGNGK